MTRKPRTPMALMEEMQRPMRSPVTRFLHSKIPGMDPEPNEPPKNQPPVEKQSASQPPVEKQSASQPPVEKQSASQPPVEKQSASQPPVEKQSASQPSAEKQCTPRRGPKPKPKPYPEELEQLLNQSPNLPTKDLHNCYEQIAGKKVSRRTIERWRVKYFSDKQILSRHD